MTAPLPSDRETVLRSRRLLAFAAMAIAMGQVSSNGHLDPFSISAMTVAMAAAIGAAFLDEGPKALRFLWRLESWLARSPSKLLWGGLLLSLAVVVILPPGYYADRGRLTLFRPLVLIATVLAVSYRWRRQPALLVRARFPLFLVLAAAMSVVVIRASPRPAIDVWFVLQEGAQGLARGENPYALDYPNIYGPGSPFYSKDFLTADGARTRGYPYLPLPLLLSLPAVMLANDPRWLFLACVLVSAWAIRRLGRGALEAELAAVFLLMQPRAFFLLEQSWTEPLVMATMAATLLAMANWRRGEEEGRTPGAMAWIGTGLCGALAAASKQYSPVILLPLLFAMPDRRRWRAVTVAALGATAVTLPFVLWDPAAFMAGIVANQQQPFREDALSWLAAVVWLGGPKLPFWLAFVVAAAVMATTLKRYVSLAQGTTVVAVTLLSMLLLHKQAFCNYYWLAGSLLLAAVALHADRLPKEEQSLTALQLQ